MCRDAASGYNVTTAHRMSGWEMRGMAWIDPLDCPYYLVSRVSLFMNTRFKRRLQEADFKQVKPAYLWALLSLWRSDGLRVVELLERRRWRLPR